MNSWSILSLLPQALFDLDLFHSIVTCILLCLVIPWDSWQGVKALMMWYCRLFQQNRCVVLEAEGRDGIDVIFPR